MQRLSPSVSISRADLYEADVVDFLREWDGRPFDVTVTSPPYGLSKSYDGTTDNWAWGDYVDWVEHWGRILYDRTADHGRLILNVPIDTNLHGHVPFDAEITMAMLAAGWEYQSKLIWDKGIVNSRTAYGSWMSPSSPTVFSPAETVLVFSKGSWTRGINGRTSDISKEQFLEYRTSVWRIRGESAKKQQHPAPYPEELVRRALLLFAFKEDLVFDPFVGSGTTCVVAEELGMQSVGVDMSLDYLTNLAAPRIAAARDLREGALTDSQGVRYINATLDESLEAAS